MKNEQVTKKGVDEWNWDVEGLGKLKWQGKKRKSEKRVNKLKMRARFLNEAKLVL